MTTYDATLFNPPAPLAQVSLRNPQNTQTLAHVPMLIDSGADVTLIPSASATQLDLVADTNALYELMGFDGNLSFASVVQLEMRFLNKTFRGQFLLIDQAWGVLGRDVLNLISISLDGPNLTWREQRGSR